MKDCFGTIDPDLQPSVDLWIALLALELKAVSCCFLWSFRERMLPVFTPSLTVYKIMRKKFVVPYSVLYSDLNKARERRTLREKDLHESWNEWLNWTLVRNWKVDMENLTNKYVAVESKSKRGRLKNKGKMKRQKLRCCFLRHILHSKCIKSCRFTVGLSLVLVNYSEVCHSSRSTKGKEKWLPLELASVTFEGLPSFPSKACRLKEQRLSWNLDLFSPWFFWAGGFLPHYVPVPCPPPPVAYSLMCDGGEVGKPRRRGKDDGRRKDLSTVSSFALFSCPACCLIAAHAPGFSETNTEAAKQVQMKRNLSKLGMWLQLHCNTRQAWCCWFH